MKFDLGFLLIETWLGVMTMSPVPYLVPLSPQRYLVARSPFVRQQSWVKTFQVSPIPLTRKMQCLHTKEDHEKQTEGVEKKKRLEFERKVTSFFPKQKRGGRKHVDTFENAVLTFFTSYYPASPCPPTFCPHPPSLTVPAESPPRPL